MKLLNAAVIAEIMMARTNADKNEGGIFRKYVWKP